MRQLSIPGLERPPQTALYFALEPDAAACAAASALARQAHAALGAGVRAYPAARYHVSVCGVCKRERLPSGLVAAAVRAGERVFAEPFELVFDRLERFGRGRGSGALVLASAEPAPMAEQLRDRLCSALVNEGFRPGRRPPLNPHVTLFYQAPLTPARPIPPMRLAVRDFVLIQSEQGLGVRHELGRWPLRGAHSARAA